MTDDRRAQGLQFFRETFTPGMVARIEKAAALPPEERDFAGDLVDLALDGVFGGLWVRPGLDRRSRSLVTLGILIALRAHEELRVHTLAGIKNGLTVDELAEVIYQSTGYAGFPAASSASEVMEKALREADLLD